MKRIFSLFLALLLALLLLPARSFAEAPSEEPAVPPAEVVVIDSTDAFLAFSRSCCLESYSAGRSFSLEADLDLSGSGFEPIPYFAGEFLGNGHRILGLDVRGDGSRMGLFREVADGAAVRDLQVQGRVTPGGTRVHVGGVAGYNAGLLDNCSFDGTVSGLENVGGIAGTNAASGLIRGCSAVGELSAEHQAGGIAGDNLGTIDGCSSSVSVNTVQILPEERSRFDLSVFSEDDFLDLANIGGVAGQNGGVIRSCLNNGSVGYPYTAYNVGGIAGKSTGFVSGCENRGRILGRRDVGGVVGQLIPHVVWDISEGSLSSLTEELGRLDALLSSVSLHAGGQSGAIREELSLLNACTSDLLDELAGVMSYYTGGMTGDLLDPERIDLDPETGLPELPDISLTGADTGALEAAMSRMYTESAVLTGLIASTADLISDDLSAVSGQIARVFDCLGAMLGDGRDGELISSYDLSADETYEHDEGAVEDCRNYASVQAESSAGGVAGSMSFELSFDMEDRLRASDFVGSDVKRYLFAALRGCESYGEVEIRADEAGGVVGRVEAGAVVACVGIGSVSSQKGDFVGGIAGSSDGCIRGCWSRSVLKGGKYIGGVAGSGQHILDCAAWTRVEGGAEYLGAVAGWAEGEVSGNRYVETSPAGVDNVSRLGQCEPLTQEAFLALDGLPEGFGDLTVRFVVEGDTVEVRRIPFGGGIDGLPEVPNDGERYWKWDAFDREHIYCSMEIGGRYYAPGTTLSSGEEIPLFLVEGVFYEGQQLTAARCTASVPEESLIAAWTLYVNDYAEALTVRMHCEEDGRLYSVGEGGSLQSLSFRKDGSYIVFTLPNGGSFVYLRQAAASRWPVWAAAGGGGLLAVTAAVLLIRKRRSRRKVLPLSESEAE